MIPAAPITYALSDRTTFFQSNLSVCAQSPFAIPMLILGVATETKTFAIEKHACINVIVIPRKEYDGIPISASHVRELFKLRDFYNISKIVPTTTLKYLKKLRYPDQPW